MSITAIHQGALKLTLLKDCFLILALYSNTGLKPYVSAVRSTALYLVDLFSIWKYFIISRQIKQIRPRPKTSFQYVRED